MSDVSSRDELIRNHFLGQAKSCDGLGSPFTAALCRAAADALDRTTQSGRTVLDWPGLPRDDAVALRFCGAMQALVLSGADAELAAAYPPDAATEADLRRLLPAVLLRHDERIVEGLKNAPQTNEVARSGMLLPGFLTVARETGLPLSVFEIGSSAGLNQFFDRFQYSYGIAAWGDHTSTVRLAPEVRGQVPPLGGELAVVARSGCDISPIDLTDPGARFRLRSYIWPDQRLRIQRFGAAVELALAAGVTVEARDALGFIRQGVGQPQAGVAKTVFHSIMWQYMPESVRAEIVGEMNAIGTKAAKDAPLAWLRMEPLDTRDPHATLMLTLWPGGETRHLAHCDYHGRWIEWIG